ncbi:serine carboxypeptidase-like 10 isoform X3 [Amaranthus tricolor]|uniref:serine carboxypeptidase-like 10 isoform X3 n=1 Tax=Amaranthus tricolor TaxID=29722 RepID=UPI002585A5CB|nr:serine carboxypeptidase-like 10 isoform X3 [Amaranthus tricolor]
MIKINMFEYFILKICLILHFQTAISLNIVKTIPGYPGNLPFYLETGYVGVGEEEEVELFYYFTKSERNPEEDPLMIWLTGGPGCSAFSGLVLEIGPLIFNTSACNWHSKSPTYQTNPFSWTKVASIIFLDSPVGTGFSYATTPEGYYSDDVTSSRHIHQFLRKWFIDHAGFLNNPLYISGDSYSGKIVPIVVQTISNGNKIGLQPIMNLQGYVLGNPFTVREDLKKSAYRYARRVSLLSDELYESTKISCNGSYEDVDVLNVQCIHNLEAVSSESIYQLLYYWANDVQVQDSLHIRKDTKPYWIRCNKTLAYEQNVESTFDYHQNLTQDFINALIYSGDQDMKISYIGTLEWIEMLNISITENWRPWFVNGEVAGYTTKFSNDRYHLTFATVKGAGHTAPEYKRIESLTMLKKWFAKEAL